MNCPHLLKVELFFQLKWTIAQKESTNNTLFPVAYGHVLMGSQIFRDRFS